MDGADPMSDVHDNLTAKQLKELHQIIQNSLDLSVDAIMNNIPGGVSVFSDRHGTIRLEYTNPGFYVLHHGSKEYWDKQSSNPVDWLVPEDRILFEKELQAVNQERKKEGSVTYRIVGEDGNLYWVNNQFRPAYKKDGIQYYYASFVDMDELKNSEQEILKAKQIYDDAASVAKLIIWNYDVTKRQAIMLKTGYTHVICKKFGIPDVIKNAPEVLSKFVAEEDRDAFLAAYHAIDDGAPKAECEFRFKLPQQERPQYERITMRRINDKKGRLLTVYCCGQNVTAQKEREERFKHAYEQLYNPNSYGSFHLNLTQDWCGNGNKGSSKIKNVLELQKSGTVNGYFAAFAALIADADIKEKFFKIFDREILLKKFANGTDTVSIEYPVVYENGERHWREGFLSMIKNPATGDVEAVTYSFDIDARKRDEFIMDKLTHVSFDYVGIIHPYNHTFEFRSRRSWITYGEVGEILNYEACCDYVYTFFSNEDERKYLEEHVSIEEIMRNLRDKGKYAVTYLRTSDGSTTTSRMEYNWLEQPEGDILVVRTDITDAYEHEQQQITALRKAKLDAEEANQAKTEFISRISHDIRTPLNGIIGMIKFAKEDIENPKKAISELNKVEVSSRYLLSLLNDVLDISKAESGKIELHPEPYPYDEFIQGLEDIFRPACQKNGQNLVIKIGQKAHGKGVIVDRVRFDQVTMNLLSNAIKYTPAGGTITYTSTSKPLPDNMVECSFIIADTGIGMSKKFQETMFEPFTQENDNPKRKNFISGTGLGLSIVKRIVDIMGGTIVVESEVGKGTKITVTFILPQATPEQLQAVLAQRMTTAQASRKPLTGKVLLAEDNEINTEIALRILHSFNLQVVNVKNGLEAVEKFKASAPSEYQVILMDIQMPAMNGYDAASTIRALPRPDASKIPIIAMTADVFADAVRKCADSGMNGHVAKPISADALYNTLTQYIK
jgi:signal transduction histidine kinase/ActR/RegA family two-component response regulator